MSSLAIDLKSVPKQKQNIIRGLNLNNDLIVLFVADGTVLSFSIDANLNLKCAAALPQPLEFEPSLVTQYQNADKDDYRVVATSPGFTSVIDFKFDPPKVETTKRKCKNMLFEIQVCLMPYFNMNTFPFIVQRLK